jgi:TetR/AcrR family transcriptional regulator, transcriptional repressor for nem operon
LEGNAGEPIMRKTREATAKSKARILTAAAKLLRERGVDATGVADVMEAAGMTNGGFYRHFESKDAMIASAIRAAFDEIAERFDRRLKQKGAAVAVQAYFEEYLSESHLEHPGHGCPVAAVGTDAARRRGVFATEFIEGAEKLIERLGTNSAGHQILSAERSEAIRRLAMLVGAVVTARAVGRSPLRKEIIAACRALFVGA